MESEYYLRISEIRTVPVNFREPCFWFGGSWLEFRTEMVNSLSSSLACSGELLFFSFEPVQNFEILSLFFLILHTVITLEFAAPSSEFALELQGEIAQ